MKLGGIRSAAFQSGVLRAIDDSKGLHSIDYLSSVSGGGYICSSLLTHINEQLQDDSNKQSVEQKRNVRSEIFICVE